MSFNFKRIKLKELCIDGKGKYGIPASSVPYDKNLFTYLRITDITDDGKINKNSLVSVDDDNAKNYILNINDIVFARTGASTGRSYFYDGSDGELVYAGFLIKFSIDDLKVNPKYIKYYCQSQEYKNWVSSFNTGSTRGNINANTFGNMEIPIIPRKQQDLLVDTLSCLDDKIELNNKINKNLEEMAQAIFKKWFVDFDYPLTDEEKAQGGCQFVDSELGKIPKGWKVGKLGESYITNIVKSGINDFIGEKVYLATADVENTTIININTKITLNEKPSRANMQPMANTVWFAKMKDSRKLILVDDYSKELINNYIFSTGFAGIECFNNSLYYIWTYLLTNEFDIIKNNLCNGTTMQAINNENINKINILIPTVKLLKLFEYLSLPIFKKWYINNKENEKLKQIRDTLLPKLINGDIRVNTVKI